MLARRLGVSDAVVIGLGSMLGAGVFVALAPAAELAGGVGMLVALGVAGFVAFCNATSSARLAARYPESGGTYVYGRERLGGFAGFLAGWGFVVGKTASCAAMALAIGGYLLPGYARWVAVAAVVGVTAVNLRGVQKTATATRVLVAVTLAVLTLAVLAGLFGGDPSPARIVSGPISWYGVLGAAGLLFFAFAGYARVATLGEEVRDPRRTIPRAVPTALGVVLAIYAVVGLTALLVLGPSRLAAAAAPLAAVTDTTGLPWLATVVRIGAAVAVLGVLLSLLAGVGRTGYAMARRADLPGVLDAVHPTYRVPHRAELAVAVAVLLLVLVADLRGAIGFSSFTVLTYYAITNLSALTLGPLPGGSGGHGSGNTPGDAPSGPGSGPGDAPGDGDGSLWRQVVAAFGLVGCLTLAFTLPWPTVVAGAGVFALGMLWYGARRLARAADREDSAAG